jgi:ubiquitin-protein ligase
MIQFLLMFLGEYPFKPPCIKLLTPIKHYCADESGNLNIAKFCIREWTPRIRMTDILESVQYILKTTKNRLKSDLQDLRNEALGNDKIRKILVNEDNLFEWRLSIFPTDVPFNVASFGLSIKFPGKCL